MYSKSSWSWFSSLFTSVTPSSVLQGMLKSSGHCRLSLSFVLVLVCLLFLALPLVVCPYAKVFLTLSSISARDFACRVSWTLRRVAPLLYGRDNKHTYVCMNVYLGVCVWVHIWICTTETGRTIYCLVTNICMGWQPPDEGRLAGRLAGRVTVHLSC